MTSPIPQIGAFESTYQPHLDLDVLETTQHTTRWRDDLELLRAAGVQTCRYPIRWHRVEQEQGVYDWTETDLVLAHMRSSGIEPIVDLLHHTSYPRWLDGFHDPRFGPAYVAFAVEVASRYPWLGAYTLFNEPFTTFLLCGSEAIWPPYLAGLRGFVSLARSVMPAVTEASRALGELLPDGRHVHVEVCERASSSTEAGADYAAYTNDRRYFLTDLLVGRPLERTRPFVADVVRAGGADLLDVEPGRVDVLGLDYYAHNQWEWRAAGEGSPVASAPPPFADLILEYHDRYDVPVIVGETNIRGFASDRATWLKYTLEQAELAREAGARVEGFCWFPFIDSCDWASLLARCDGAVDPVGVYSLGRGFEREATVMTAAYAAAAHGAPASSLPAYTLRPPVSRWLQGWLPQMAHWSWETAPGDDTEDDVADYDIELRVVDA